MMQMNTLSPAVAEVLEALDRSEDSPTRLLLRLEVILLEHQQEGESF
jgi:hypothetical protein